MATRGGSSAGGNGTGQTLNINIKDREVLYQLMVSQLFYDGYQDLAHAIRDRTKVTALCPPSDRLMHLVATAIKSEQETNNQEASTKEGGAPLKGIDMDMDSESTKTAPEPATYETVYVTSHKAPCRSGVFSPDGLLCATGSVDASIKVLEVERMVAKSGVPPDRERDRDDTQDSHPVIRTLYDHTEEVTCLQFHPTEQILVSGSEDETIKMFDITKPNVKRAIRSIQECYPVKCLAFHPTGDYLLVGTQHPTLRLYDVHTSQCFVSAVPTDQHTDSLTMMDYTSNGASYVTSSLDGNIKIWDGVSNRCVQTLMKAHDGAEVCSVMFSRNGKYILSSGKDSLVKLWELSMSRCLIAYTGVAPVAGANYPPFHRAEARFNHNEDYVVFPDERSATLYSWDARNADRLRPLPLGHQGSVRSFAHSPIIPAFLTCSEDHRARFWYHRPTPSGP